MKTQISKTSSIVLNGLKQTLYALQVLIIAFAIPVLSYMELSHHEPKNAEPSYKNVTADPVKSNAVAFNRNFNAELFNIKKGKL